MSNRNDTSRPRRWRADAAAALAAALALLALAACEDQHIELIDPEIFEPRLSPREYMLVAVSDADPDKRRRATARLAESDQVNTDWAIEGLATIAAVDSDAQTRCVAIRGMARSGGPRAVDTALLLLSDPQSAGHEQVRAPDALTRAEAAAALAELAARGAVPDDRREAVAAALLGRLANDRDRHVRRASARALGGFPQPAVVDGLIQGLRDDDFAVAYQCEMSLVKLTGVTHDCEVLAWKTWASENAGNLFAQAGNVPDHRKPHYTNDIEAMSYSTQQWFRWIFPGKKEQ